MGEVRREYLGGIGAVILVSLLAWLVASQTLLGNPVFQTGTPGLALTPTPPLGETHYTCPMHPSVKSPDVGQCPLCGMDLTPVRTEPEGISHYTCAMHPSIENAGAGQCPVCGMDLTPVSFEDKRSG